MWPEWWDWELAFTGHVQRRMEERGTGEKSARTEASSDGLLVVDYAADGRPIGVEITAPDAVTLDRLNGLLAGLGQPPLPEQEFRPLTECNALVGASANPDDCFGLAGGQSSAATARKVGSARLEIVRRV